MIFDYIFYRLYLFFATRGSSPQTPASLVLSLVQFLTLLDMVFIAQYIIDFSIPSKYYFLPTILAFGGMNWYRYERAFNIELFTEKWGHESNLSKVKRGWWIGLYVSITFLFPLVNGILRQNLGNA